MALVRLMTIVCGCAVIGLETHNFYLGLGISFIAVGLWSQRE